MDAKEINANDGWDHQQVRDMLRREHSLRLSSEVQEQYRLADRLLDNSWLKVTVQVQKQVLAEFGHEPSEENLFKLRKGALAHPDISLQVRYNRSRRGQLKVGDEIPPLDLVSLDTMNTVNLKDIAKSESYTVLVSGSYS